VNTLLELDNIKAGYGKMEVLQGISLEVREGEIVALVGANGVGKTTTLRTIIGQLKPLSGSIRFQDRDLTNYIPHQVVALGISYAPEGRDIFGNLTVEENLRAGGYLLEKRKMKARLEQVYELFPRLHERCHQNGASLSGGEQQMLAIGRALMVEPALMLLDEPSLGLAPIIAHRIFEKLQQINQNGTSILLVEQNVSLALQISHRGYVMEKGMLTITGDSTTLQENDHVKKAYLGVA
jgi:branched-chain amino acid transport system ATP-binding protein